MWLLKIVGRQFNSVCYVNAFCALRRYYLLHKDRPALKSINLANEMRNSGAFTILPQGASQQLPDTGRLPIK